MVCPFSLSRPSLSRSLGTGCYASHLLHADGRAAEAEGWLVAVQQTPVKSACKNREPGTPPRAAREEKLPRARKPSATRSKRHAVPSETSLSC